MDKYQEIKYLNTQYDFTNPEKLGRGCWYSLLVLTATADDEITQTIVCRQIRNIVYIYFKCLNCKKHSGKYLEKHPPEELIGVPDGLFYYIVDMMNDINLRIGKPLYDRKVLFLIFHDDAYVTCSKNCGDKTSESNDIYEKEPIVTLPEETAKHYIKHLPGLLRPSPYANRRS